MSYSIKCGKYLLNQRNIDFVPQYRICGIYNDLQNQELSLQVYYTQAFSQNELKTNHQLTKNKEKGHNQALWIHC